MNTMNLNLSGLMYANSKGFDKSLRAEGFSFYSSKFAARLLNAAINALCTLLPCRRGRFAVVKFCLITGFVSAKCTVTWVQVRVLIAFAHR